MDNQMIARPSRARKPQPFLPGIVISGIPKAFITWSFDGGHAVGSSRGHGNGRLLRL
jgi:hypothetical protein